MFKTDLPAELEAEDNECLRRFETENNWGLCALINAFNCNPSLIKDPDAIRKYIIDICKLIDMERYGEPIIKRFGSGDKEGFSFVQLIETSAIVGHFAEDNNVAYIDIFSCKGYKPNLAANFTADFFESDEYSLHVILREKE